MLIWSIKISCTILPVFEPRNPTAHLNVQSRGNRQSNKSWPKVASERSVLLLVAVIVNLTIDGLFVVETIIVDQRSYSIFACIQGSNMGDSV